MIRNIFDDATDNALINAHLGSLKVRKTYSPLLLSIPFPFSPLSIARMEKPKKWTDALRDITKGVRKYAFLCKRKPDDDANKENVSAYLLGRSELISDAPLPPLLTSTSHTFGGEQALIYSITISNQL